MIADRLRARERAERCFALARSTTYTGERESAIAKGTAIATEAGLDLDLFDIPGRVRQPRQPRAASRPSEHQQYSREELRDLMRAHRGHMEADSFMRAAMHSFEDSLRRRAAAAGAQDDETVYDARRRNFERAAAEARERDARRTAR